MALSFFVFGLWALKPDELKKDQKLRGTGVFVTTLIVFFLVAMGDKTQLATVALAARLNSPVYVVQRATLGTMIANVPAVWMGKALAQRMNMKMMHWIAAALFVVLGILTLLAAHRNRMTKAPTLPAIGKWISGKPTLLKSKRRGGGTEDR